MRCTEACPWMPFGGKERGKDRDSEEQTGPVIAVRKGKAVLITDQIKINMKKMLRKNSVMQLKQQSSVFFLCLNEPTEE